MITDEDREAIRNLDAAGRKTAIGEQLRRIREAAANEHNVDAAAVNDALDRIEALQDEAPSAPAPAHKGKSDKSGEHASR